ncbi:MAG: GNAT family N-acetyltransferase [Chloroflexi bacterium]|nr:GNAT family N-acetyltransferase [Chloroflexota bacterium]
MFPFLKLTDHIISLRPYEFGDEDELFKAVRESLPDLNPWMSWANDNYSVETARTFITLTRSYWSSGSMYAFAITDANNGELLGSCSLSHIHPLYRFCNLGYWVRSSQRGKGIAGCAAKLIARFAFEKASLIRAEIVIAAGNTASRRVAQKIRAHDEGLLLNRMVIGTRVCDAHMFSLLPSDFGLVAQL